MPRNARIPLAIMAIIAIIVAVTMLPVAETLLDLVERIRALGPAGGVLYALLYAAITPTLIPATLLTLGAGFAYGPLLGFAVVWPGATIGATVAFLLGRTLFRDAISRRVENNPRFHAIDRAIGEQGLWIATFVRLSPVFPFGLLNYALGLTQISLRDFIVSTAVGILPGVLLYTYIGSTASNISDLVSGGAKGGWAGQALFIGGLVATLAVTVLITRIARKALADALESPLSTTPE